MEVGDVTLVNRLGDITRHGRELLCTLARRGKALRRDQPARAAWLLASVAVSPLYKVGRLFFDMAELEDLMLDGSAPPLLDDAAVENALRAFAGSVEGLTRVLSDVAREAGVRKPAARAKSSEGSRKRREPGVARLPVLASADYLFDLVALGWMSEISKLLIPRDPPQPAS